MGRFFVLWVACVVAGAAPLHPSTAKKQLHPSVREMLLKLQEPLLSQKVSSESPHQTSRHLNLLNEPGYHNCPEWAGGHWCAEGYLCGDGNNGGHDEQGDFVPCEYGTCCNEDVNIATCANQEETPCGVNANDDVVGGYHCCDETLICGDGTSCTSGCPKGECCEFDPELVSDCGYEAPPDDPCPDNLSRTCCEAPWDMAHNRLVENGRADYGLTNQNCFENPVVQVDPVSGFATAKIDCNVGLNSFEYVCQHELGAICAFGVDYNLTDGSAHVSVVSYECVATECDTDANEDNLELHFEQKFRDLIAEEGYQITALDVTIDCDSLPDNYDETGCSGLKMDGNAVKFCDSLMREDCTADTSPDTCGDCLSGYLSPVGGENTACYSKGIVEAHSVDGNMETAGVVFITMFVTLVVAAAALYGIIQYRRKKKTEFLRAGQSKLIKTDQSNQPPSDGPVVPALQEMGMSAATGGNTRDYEEHASDEAALIVDR